jgi:drug/metabolite transporter (DMT)-like permease
MHGGKRTMGNYRKTGYLLVVLGGLFWALSGVCGQFLFTHKGWEATWLVPMRLLCAGSILTAISCAVQKRDALRIFKKKRDFGALLIFGLLGVGVCQLTYFLTIQHSNAATATVLCYVGPVIVIVFVALRNRRLPSPAEATSVLLVIFGTFMLATHGNPTTLVISNVALVCGLTSSAAQSLYTLQPRRIIKEFGTIPVTGWGMLIAGVFMSLLLRPWHVVGVYDAQAFGAFSVIVLLGTVVSFSCFLEGVRRIGPVKGNILSAAEPLGSTVMSIVLLGTVFAPADFAGFACILSTIFILAWNDTMKARREKKLQSQPR